MEIEGLVAMALAFLMGVTLIIAIGGVILFKPLMRNLGNFLEAKAEERRALAGRSPEDWDRLFNSLETFGRRLEALEERQDFTERLLAKPKQEGKEA